MMAADRGKDGKALRVAGRARDDEASREAGRRSRDILIDVEGKVVRRRGDGKMGWGGSRWC